MNRQEHTSSTARECEAGTCRRGQVKWSGQVKAAATHEQPTQHKQTVTCRPDQVPDPYQVHEGNRQGHPISMRHEVCEAGKCTRTCSRQEHIGRQHHT